MKWIVLGSILVLVIIALAIWIFLPGKRVLSAKQETAALTTLLGRSPHLTQVSPTTWKPYNSKYLSFQYPANATVYVQDNTKAIQNGALDSFAFTLLDEHVSVTIQAVQFNEALLEYPAVAVRVLQNTLYTSTAATSATEISFAKEQDIIERSKFFLKNGKLVSVAVTGYADREVQEIFDTILSSLKAY